MLSEGTLSVMAQTQQNFLFVYKTSGAGAPGTWRDSRGPRFSGAQADGSLVIIYAGT